MAGLAEIEEDFPLINGRPGRTVIDRLQRKMRGGRELASPRDYHLNDANSSYAFIAWPRRTCVLVKLRSRSSKNEQLLVDVNLGFCSNNEQRFVEVSCILHTSLLIDEDFWSFFSFLSVATNIDLNLLMYRYVNPLRSRGDSQDDLIGEYYELWYFVLIFVYCIVKYWKMIALFPSWWVIPW